MFFCDNSCLAVIRNDSNTSLPPLSIGYTENHNKNSAFKFMCSKNWFHLNRKYISGILPKMLSGQAEYD
jgi:hypothetical protein